MDQHIVGPSKVCNLTSWIEYYMWDATSQIACNLSSGFCLAGKDLWGTLFGLRVVIQVVGCLMPIPQALIVTTRWIRRMLLVYFLDQLYFTATGIGAEKWKRSLGVCCPPPTPPPPPGQDRELITINSIGANRAGQGRSPRTPVGEIP